MSDLVTKLNAVKDEKTFLLFVEALAEDRRGDPSEWQWGKIEDFLEACASWGKASKKGLKYYELPESPWRRAADILFSGKIYE